MKKIVSLIALAVLLLTVNALAAKDDSLEKIAKFKSDAASKNLEDAMVSAIEQGLDICTISATAMEMEKNPEKVAAATIAAGKKTNTDISIIIPCLSKAGISSSIIAKYTEEDQGLGFGDDPALGGDGANPKTPPGDVGGGLIGGGVKPPISPSNP